ncbi:MAG: hypothetical protein J1E62_05145 [Lachnospiraceae bacterium]|nr:hypothetical protein [Lachnospiraceae bacterium]
MDNLSNWLQKQFDADSETIIEALKMSPSAQGYIHGALSEILLSRYLRGKGYRVYRIKEKPSGGFDNKKVGYKGDFLIHKPGTEGYYVVECKGLKTNSEFRQASTDEDDHIKKLTINQAFSTLKKYINPDKNKIYEKGFEKYRKAKDEWEQEYHGYRSPDFPEFRWSREHPGPNNVDLSGYFKDLEDLRSFIESSDPKRLYETSFRERKGLYLILQTHEPNTREDPETWIQQAAPLVSDFSMMAVDLFQRTGKHEFVFMNPNDISHSPTSPNHLYQNYIIDILVPGRKDKLKITPPWYLDIDKCISDTNPKTVKYDPSQLDYR